MKFVGFIKNGKGILNEVDEPFRANATINVLNDHEGVQVVEINLGDLEEKKERRGRKPKSKNRLRKEEPASH